MSRGADGNGAARRPHRRAPGARAKLNVYLDVIGRRDDGFHELETLFLPLPWGDDVVFEIERTSSHDGAPRIALEVDGADVPSDERNLAWRAVLAFDEALQRAGSAERIASATISLRKRVPVGAGLGGGSSNAAVVLRALARLFPALSDDVLDEIHRGLGADVPFFRHGRPAVGRGRGDELQPVKAARGIDVVLILPRFGCATATVFGNLAKRVRKAPPDGLQRAVEALRTGDPAAMRAAHYNALAVPAMAAYPALLRFTSDVERRLGRPPALSGSGSTLFDLPDEGELRDVIRRLEGIEGDVVRVRA